MYLSAKSNPPPIAINVVPNQDAQMLKYPGHFGSWNFGEYNNPKVTIHETMLFCISKYGISKARIYPLIFLSEISKWYKQTVLNCIFFFFLQWNSKLGCPWLEHWVRPLWVCVRSFFIWMGCFPTCVGALFWFPTLCWVKKKEKKSIILFFFLKKSVPTF